MEVPTGTVGAVVVKGTPKPGERIVAALGQPTLATGLITFRDRTTKVAVATVSTTGGSVMTTSALSNCEMVVSPAALQELVTVDVYFSAGSFERPAWVNPVGEGHHWAEFGPYPWQRRAGTLPQ